jgi:peptidoglycan/LPS O-acetylase OafA/YrhL
LPDWGFRCRPTKKASRSIETDRTTGVSATTAPGTVEPPRFNLLDGLRGIAALLVLTLHTANFWTFYLDRAYLAVDLFLILSGFVIAHSHDQRVRSGALSAGCFLGLRYVRLYPFFAVSLCIGLLVQAWKGPIGPGNYMQWLLALFLVPAGVGGPGPIFRHNYPLWSIFYELVVNLAYALIRPKLTNRGVRQSTLLAALALVATSYTHHSLDSGPLGGAASVAGALSRCFLGFFCGVALRHLWNRFPTGMSAGHGRGCASCLAGRQIAWSGGTVVIGQAVLDPYAQDLLVHTHWGSRPLLAAARRVSARSLCVNIRVNGQCASSQSAPPSVCMCSSSPGASRS